MLVSRGNNYYFFPSFRSLVATNDHLLRELEDTKERHAQEMLQMNVNYDHLRKTIDFMRHV